MKKMRNSWLELYRVLAMLLIVGNHFATQGVLPQSTVDSMPLANYVVTQLFGCGGKLGVDMFVLLTGYFLADSQRSWSSILRLWGTTVFWGVALLVPFAFADRADGFGFGDALTPLLNGHYWFVTTYCCLMLLVPYLVVLLRGIDRLRHGALIVILVTLFSVLQKKAEMYGFSPLAWFVTVFFIGAYIRKWVDLARVRKWIPILVLAVSAAIVVGWIVYCDLKVLDGKLKYKWTNIREMNSLPMLTISVATFVLFAKLKPFTNRFVNALASCTFGVYLIHEHPLVIPFLWRDALMPTAHVAGCGYMLYAVGVTCGLFSACAALEYVRVCCAKWLMFWYNARIGVRCGH
mgnify:CR=1 FL=1